MCRKTSLRIREVLSYQLITWHAMTPWLDQWIDRGNKARSLVLCHAHFKQVSDVINVRAGLAGAAVKSSPSL